jgi:hypothetical protein
VPLPDDNRPLPWRPPDVISAAVLNVVGLALIVAGYVVSAHTAVPDHQLLATNLAVGGLAVALCANALWLLTGLREVGLLRRAVLAGRTVVAAPARASEQLAPDALVATSTMAFYHRPECSVVAGKRAAPSPLRSHESQGRRPCPMCRPAPGEPTPVSEPAVSGVAR